MNIGQPAYFPSRPSRNQTLIHHGDAEARRRRSTKTPRRRRLVDRQEAKGAKEEKRAPGIHESHKIESCTAKLGIQNKSLNRSTQREQRSTL
jgi:hypothetical protein